jgi:DNA-binding MurR/RpiR family transcriptional regulator
MRTETLDASRERALIALCNESNIKAAAKAAGISEATIHRYLREDEFKAAYRQMRRDALEGATARLSALATAAVETIAAIMLNPKVGAQTRLRAAIAVLDMAYRSAEQDLVLDRLDALERQQEEDRYAYGR